MLFKEEQRRHQLTINEMETLSDAVTKSQEAALRAEIAELHECVKDAHEAQFKLHAQTKQFQDQARLWEDEYAKSKSELEKRTAAFDEETKKGEDEMRRYIKDYYVKTHNPAYYNLHDLQEMIIDLEHELSQTSDYHSQTKIDKSNLEDEIRRLHKEIAQHKNTIEEFIGATFHNENQAYPHSYVSGVPNADDASEIDALSNESIYWLLEPENVVEKQRVARIDLPDARKNREAKVAAI